MRILLLLEATLGGTARHILDLTSGLLALDHEVHLLYSRVRADHAFTSGLAALQASEPRFFSHEIAMQRELGLSDLRSYVELHNYIQRQQPFDILHAHSTKAGFLMRLIIPRRGAAVIYTPHGLMTLNRELKGISRWAVSSLESLLAKVSDAVIAVSEAERQCATETGIPSELLSVIHNGLNAAHAPDMAQRGLIRSRLGLESGTVCIATIGLLVANKEHGKLLEAFALAASKTSRQLVLLLIGWGPLEAELRAKASALGIANSVRFLGQVSGIEYLPAADIFAHASRYEGFGYVFLEALSGGIPIVTTRVGGADELIESGITGHICNDWNTDEFATYLQRFIESPALRNDAAPKAREQAAKASFAVMLSSTVGLYRSLLKTADATCEELNDTVASRTPQ